MKWPPSWLSKEQRKIKFNSYKNVVVPYMVLNIMSFFKSGFTSSHQKNCLDFYTV